MCTVHNVAHIWLRASYATARGFIEEVGGIDICLPHRLTTIEERVATCEEVSQVHAQFLFHFCTHLVLWGIRRTYEGKGPQLIGKFGDFLFGAELLGKETIVSAGVIGFVIYVFTF